MGSCPCAAPRARKVQSCLSCHASSLSLVQVRLPSSLKLSHEVINAAPINADIRPLEVVLEVAPRSLRIQVAALLRADLGGNVGVAAAPVAPLLPHQAPEERPEVPVVHPEPQEQQRRV